MPDGVKPVKEFSASASDMDKRLLDKRTLFVSEGGTVYSAVLDGQPCLVTDEGMLAEYDPELGQIDPRVRLFHDVPHRDAYVATRGWSELRAHWREDRLDRLRRHVDEAYCDGGLEDDERKELLARLAAFALGRPVGGLEARHHVLLPDVLEFTASGAYGRGTSVRWNGDTLIAQVWRATSSEGESRLEIQPTAEQWRAFWRALGRMGAWTWQSEPEHPGLMDEPRGLETWRLQVSHRGRVAELSGWIGFDDPRYSRDGKIRRALERLLDGWPLDDEG